MRYLILISILFLTGCAALETGRSDFDSCASDPECLAKIQQISTASTGLAGILGGAMSSPASIPIAAAISLITTALAGVYLGRKKRVP